ncbi:FKBP-type peptidyl-prolyl cis-trans isomerase [Solitalea lacus]|uniref:FKBP-type peptidyl-prolyl cis-trans isomerase n=1 Tax=Solitalea lacus TaxID=2911172 RepID=UPI001EDBE38B|nr:FKBP-type peptidyl-prolyl cis-trans isomerase [Solitalea lacus]UKJ07197.1 FKBP-type peptidyl-prolyl cis-trans isomerase [Solitalea lacus]
MRKLVLALTVLFAAFAFTACLKSEEPTPFDYQAQWKTDSTTISNYINTNSLTGVQKTSTGLNYQIIEEGTGVAPAAASIVTVGYTGKFTNGNVFDSSESFKYQLNRLIPGWIEGLQKIKEGGKMKLLVPSHLGYGPYANGPIPANSVLIFDIELKKVE